MAICAGCESALSARITKRPLTLFKKRSYPDLLEVEEVLQRRDLAQEDAVRDRMGSQESRSEVVGVASFPRMRSKPERV